MTSLRGMLASSVTDLSADGGGIIEPSMFTVSRLHLSQFSAVKIPLSAPRPTFQPTLASNDLFMGIPHIASVVSEAKSQETHGKLGKVIPVIA